MRIGRRAAVDTWKPIRVLHCADLMIAVRSVMAKECSPSGVVAAMIRDVELECGDFVNPDLVTVPGNIAGQARLGEYEAAFEIFGAMRERFEIDYRRIVVVPGDRDVNKLRCQAYFLQREADGLAPVPPFWEKWQPFAELVHRLYGIEFPKDEPWLLLEYPELRIVVAAVNSTMGLEHRNGSSAATTGRVQNDWFARRLAKAEYTRWRRIGLLHHRPAEDGSGRPGQVTSEFAADGCVDLGDSGAFSRQLGPRLDLVLHGQPEVPHQQGTAARRVLGEHGAPVFGAAPGGTARLVEIGATNATAPHQPGGGSRTALPVPFPRRVRRPKPRVGDTCQQDDLLDLVAEIMRMRQPGAQVATVAWRGPHCRWYLRIAHRPAGAAANAALPTQYPVGVFAVRPNRGEVRRFIDEVVSRFQTGGAATWALLVHTGPAAAPELVDWARGRGVAMITVASFEVGTDLAPFARQQAVALRNDQRCRPGWYVAQRFIRLGAAAVPQSAADLAGWLQQWVGQPAGRLVVLLGHSGTGKTTLLRELARRIGDPETGTIPVLIDLGEFERSHDFDEMVALNLSRMGQRSIDLGTFRYLRRAGRVVLLVDGLDEYAGRVGYDRAAHQLNTLAGIAEARAKVVIACRDQFFRSDAEVAAALHGAGTGFTAGLAESQIIRLVDFDDAQVQDYLDRRLGEQHRVDPDRVDPDRSVRRLTPSRLDAEQLALLHNPRVLVDAIESRLISASAVGTPNRSVWYRTLLDRWLAEEARRLRRIGLTAVAQSDLLTAVTELAMSLWARQTNTVGIDELEAFVATSPPTGAASKTGSASLAERFELEPAEAAHLVAVRTLLRRSGELTLGFQHQSIVEWLVANHLAQRIEANPVDDGYRLDHRLDQPMSTSLVGFLCAMAGPAAVRRWAEHQLQHGAAPIGLVDNAATVLRHLRRSTGQPAGFHVGDGHGRPIGREEVLATLHQRYDTRSPVALLGPRRAGKSWVLREFGDQLRDLGVTGVRQVSLPIPGSNCRRLEDIAALFEPGQTGKQTARRLLDQIGDAGGSPVFLIDEVGRLTGYEPRAVSWLRGLSQAGAFIVYAGTPKDWHSAVLWALRMPGSSFGNDVGPVALGPWARPTAVDFLVETAAQLGVEISESTAELAIELVGTWPFYLQVIGDAMVAAARRQGSGALADRATVADLVESRLLEDWQAHFLGRWSEIGPAGRAALLRAPGASPQSPSPLQAADLVEAGLHRAEGWLDDPPFFAWIARNAESLRAREA